MAKGFFGKVLSFIGLEAQEQDDNYEDEELEPGEAEPEVAAGLAERRRRGSVVALSTPKAMRMVVVEPTTFDEVQAIALNLRNRRPVIVNLEHADREVARRIIDFMSGATYALGGSMQRVGGGIFLFAPHNVDVAAQTRQLSEEGLGGANWSPQ